MKVSLVIPTYNEEKYIEKCLDSIKSQTAAPDEIILIDNNSTDNTVAIAKKFKVKIINEKQQGISFARNRGFNEAKYDIIARCDADCILPSTWIQQIKEAFGSKKIDALGGPLYYFDIILPNKKLFVAFIKLMKVILGHYPLIGPNMIVTKKIWNKVKNQVCNDNNLVHEDIDLAIHINKIGGKIGYDEKLISTISSRRLKNNPYSYFIEYPDRWIRTLQHHK